MPPRSHDFSRLAAYSAGRKMPHALPGDCDMRHLAPPRGAVYRNCLKTSSAGQRPFGHLAEAAVGVARQVATSVVSGARIFASGGGFDR